LGAWVHPSPKCFVIIISAFLNFCFFSLSIELKMGCGRIQIASNKKSALLKQSMREVATMLMQDPPQEEKARIRAEALIRDDNLIEAYEILQLECELLHERIKLIEYSKTCPHDLVSVISTLIWASHRVDIKELVLIRKQFTAKYGKSFEENAMRNVDGVLNERVVSKLSVEPPAAYLVQTYLERICEFHNVEWTPSVKLTAESAVQPMVSGVSLS
jgi:vacuolar protein sorting-associated protein IST1